MEYDATILEKIPEDFVHGHLGIFLNRTISYDFFNVSGMKIFLWTYKIIKKYKIIKGKSSEELFSLGKAFSWRQEIRGLWLVTSSKERDLMGWLWILKDNDSIETKKRKKIKKEERSIHCYSNSRVERALKYRNLSGWTFVLFFFLWR